MASVTARKTSAGVTWRVRFRIDGEMVQRSFVHKKGADEFGALVDRIGGTAALQVLEARQNRRSDVPTLKEWTARYLDPASGLLTGIEDGTRAGYERIASRSFLPILGEYPIDAIGKADVGKWVAWQEQQPSTARVGQKVSAKTVRNYHAVLSAVLASAVSEGLREDNPAYRTRLTRGVKHEGVFLSRDEFATLLHFVPSYYEGLVMFLAGTGCRWGEATALTWGDVNLNARTPTVRISKAWKKARTGSPVLRQPKSARGHRTISLPPDVAQALGTPGPAHELVFPGMYSGTHLWYGRFRTSTWDVAVAKAMNPELCAAEGLTPLTRHPTIHDLRHTHASWLIAGRAPLTHIQARLGHESIQTTSNTYGHLQPDAHDAMADIIAATLANVRPLKQIEGNP